MSPKELNIPLANGLKLAALAWGDESNPPILALHGWLDNAHSFLPLAPFFNEYYFVALDFPGHGHSQHLPASYPYHFIDMVWHVFQAVDALQWHEFIILGHSMGAGVATLMAGTFPARIKTLWLIEGLGPLTYPDKVAPKQLAKFIGHYQQYENQALKVYPNLESAVTVRSKNSNLSIPASRLICQRAVKSVAAGLTWRHDPKLLLPSPLRLTETQTLNFIGNITAPTYLIMADSGYPYEKKCFETRFNALKFGNLITLPGKHHLHMDYPGKVAKALS